MFFVNFFNDSIYRQYYVEPSSFLAHPPFSFFLLFKSGGSWFQKKNLLSHLNRSSKYTQTVLIVYSTKIIDKNSIPHKLKNNVLPPRMSSIGVKTMPILFFPFFYKS